MADAELEEDTCEKSEHADGPKHSWKFDGDNPIIVCVYCDQMRDAITGRLLGSQPINLDRLPPIPAPRGDEPQTEWADGFEWRTLLDIDVIARPRPQGSIRATINRSTGRALAVKHNEPQQDAWRSYVRRDALDSLPQGHVAVDGPVRVVIEFVLVRPKSTPKRAVDPIPAATRPDGDKLERAVWDALGEAGVYRDDARITSWAGSKRLARADEQPHARIRVAVPA